jgi:hypothetical protein
MRLNYLAVICALVLTVGQANADTFAVFKATGTFTESSLVFPLGGSLTVDITSGAFSNASLTLVGEPWTNIISQGPDAVAPYYDLTVQTPFVNTGCTPLSSCHDTLQLVISTSPSLLVTDQGGLIVSGSAGLRDAGITINLVAGELSPVPLPAALPLFATGLGVLGLFAWRRKRNNTAVAIATP